MRQGGFYFIEFPDKINLFLYTTGKEELQNIEEPSEASTSGERSKCEAANKSCH